MDFKNLKNLKDNLKKLRNIYGNNEKNFLMSEKTQENLLEGLFTLQEKSRRRKKLK